VRGAKGSVATGRYKARQPGGEVRQKVEIPRNTGSLRLRRIGDRDATESGDFRMFTHERTSLGMVNFNLSATVSSGGSEHTIFTKALEVDVVDGYKLMSPEDSLVLNPGTAGAWLGSIWRDPEFRRTVTVRVIDLPTGVQCQEAEVPSDQTGYELHCKSTGDVAAGNYEVELHAESMLSDEGTTRYLVDPVKARLTVQ